MCCQSCFSQNVLPIMFSSQNVLSIMFFPKICC
jgi:hypothetical protein